MACDKTFSAINCCRQEQKKRYVSASIRLPHNIVITDPMAILRKPLFISKPDHHNLIVNFCMGI